MAFVERARTFMDSMRDNRHRIAAAAQVDQYYSTYEIELSPEEALSFAATVPSDKPISESLYVLIDAINQVVPKVNFGESHPKTGTRHHRFRLGRRFGDRLMMLEVFRGYLPKDYSLDSLTDMLRKLTEDLPISLEQESDEHSFRLTFLWFPQGKK